jgi:hypothetical protein
LQREIGLTDGSLFRGRVANIAGTEFEPQYAWVPFVGQHNYDAAVAFYSGNDHRYYGLWYFGIPTLIVDNQFSSPFLHVINSRLLSNPTQKQVRSQATITRFEPHIFAMLGVRFVITSRPLPGLTPKSTYAVLPEHADTWSLFLYELTDAKTAGYWALRPMFAESARQALLWTAKRARFGRIRAGPHSARRRHKIGAAGIPRPPRGRSGKSGHFAPRAPARVQPLLRCADREFHPG